MYTNFRICLYRTHSFVSALFISIALYLAILAPSFIIAQTRDSLPSLDIKPPDEGIVKATGRGSQSVLVLSKDEFAQGVKKESPLRMELLALFPPAFGDSRVEIGLEDRLYALVLASAAPRSLKGLEYWSASRQRMRTLYSKAYMIGGKDDKREIPDPVSLIDLGFGPPWRFFTYLQDLTFGGNIFSFEVTILDGSLIVTISNAETLRYAGMPLAKPGGMIQTITAKPYAEGLLVHCVTLLYAPDFLARRVFESAGNKTLALLGWFAGRVERVGYKTPHPLPVNIEDVASAR